MKETMEKIVTIDGVLSCYLVDREGEIVGSAGKNKLDKSLVSALIASMSKELTTQMDIQDNFSITILAAEKNLFIITHRNFILAVFTSPNIDTGKIRFELRKSVKEISEKL
jgi:predicted regulator of Ras-like GTPase activity (Roadblock/LC7/MglB family)